MAEARTRKRKRGVDLEELAKIFADEPRDIKAAWAEVKEMIDNARKDATGYIPSVSLSPFDGTKLTFLACTVIVGI